MVPFIDVSKWQGAIDVRQVAETQRGVIARATVADQTLDPMFAANVAAVRASGRLWFGAYHNLVNASVMAQVGRFVNVLSDWKGIIPMVDSEQGASFAQLAQFVEAIKVELGVRPLVYLPRWYWLSLPDRGSLPSTWTWVHSHYASTPGPLIPPLMSLNGHVWQYSQTGRVSGINAAVDLNTYYGNEEDLLQLAVQ
jgi:lysozyme